MIHIIFNFPIFTLYFLLNSSKKSSYRPTVFGYKYVLERTIPFKSDKEYTINIDFTGMEHVKELLKKTMIENNCTAVFEVVSPEYDPHIIKYDKEHLYLLDFIENKLDLDTHNIDLEFSENLMKKVEFSKNFHNLFSETFQKIVKRTGCFPNVSQELLV